MGIVLGLVELLLYSMPESRKKVKFFYSIQRFAIVHTVSPILVIPSTPECSASTRHSRAFLGKWTGSPDAQHLVLVLATKKVLEYSGGASISGKELRNRGNLFTNSGTPWLVALALPTLELWLTCG